MSGIQDWLLNDLSHRVVTGFEDAVDAETGEKIKKPIYDSQAVERMDGLYKAVVDADKAYSKELGTHPINLSTPQLNHLVRWLNWLVCQKGCTSTMLVI